MLRSDAPASTPTTTSKNTSLLQSSPAGLRSKRAGVDVGASFLRPSVLYTCSPMRYLMHTATTPSLRKAADRSLLVLTPHTTTPVICVSIETRVVPSLAKIRSCSTHSPYSRYSFTRSTSSCTCRKDPGAGQRAEGGQRLRNLEKLRRVCPKGVQRTHLQDLTRQDARVRLGFIHDKGAWVYFRLRLCTLFLVLTVQTRCPPPCAPALAVVVSEWARREKSRATRLRKRRSVGDMRRLGEESVMRNRMQPV